MVAPPGFVIPKTPLAYAIWRAKLWKWRLQEIAARRCFDIICYWFPEMRATGDIFFPKLSRTVDWKSGLADATWMLQSVVRLWRPKVVVEIGSARGQSTCTLAQACRQNGLGKVYAIDPNTPNDWSESGTGGDNYEFLRARLREYGLDPWCEVIRETSVEAAKHWTGPIDFLFIDGDHSYEGVKHDFEAFKPWLTEHAIVAFHDTAWEHHRAAWEQYRDQAGSIPHMGVPRYLEELKAQGFNSVTFPAQPGFTLLQATPGGFPFMNEPQAQPAVSQARA